MPRETIAAKRERAVEFCRRMGELYPAAQPQLDFSNPFTTVIATMLSAQTTDASVNRVTPELFSRWPGPAEMAAASPAEIGEVIRSLGFWRAKSEHCVGISQMIMADFGGEVPHTMKELTHLPGVGRKTANIVLNRSFGIVDGIAVDTHVYRIATRLRFTSAPTPLEAEQDLLRLLPRELWGDVNSEWILFGRKVCSSRNPRCEECPCLDLCPRVGLPGGAPAPRKSKASGMPKARKTSGRASKGERAQTR